MICNCSPPLGPRCTQKAVLVHILRCIGKGKSNLLRPPFSVYSGPLFRFTPAPFSVYSGPLFGLLRPPFRFTPDTFFHNPQQKHTLEKFTPGKSGFTPGHFRVYSGLFSGTFSGLLRDIFGFTPGHFRVYSGTFSDLLQDLFCTGPVLFATTPTLSTSPSLLTSYPSSETAPKLSFS